MAFRFNWPEFNKDFYNEAKSQLETAMNKGKKPSVIVDYITVKELDMGTKPPELEILEIGELGNDKFRGIFKLTYAGDAYIEIQTKVQANPMHAKETVLPRHCRPSILAADQPLVVPMILRISDLKLRGIIVLVVSKTKGVTLVFKNDPLESIRVSSTFDCVSILRDFLQRQIEAQLRQMFQEDIPAMIHNLSTKYIQSEQEKKYRKEQEERLQEKLTELSPVLQRLRSNTSISSLPELDLSYFEHKSVSSSSSSTVCTPTAYSFDDDLGVPSIQSAFLNRYLDSELKKSTDSLQLVSAPMTAANLFTHNKQYQLGLHSPSFLYAKSSFDSQSETELSVISSIYANDADAPWYATEGPNYLMSEEPDTLEEEDECIMQDPVILSPLENHMAAVLSRLTKTHYTLSPFTDTISHFTYRSSPQVKKSNSTSHTRNKKIPKRRVTRLNISAPKF